jgi:peptide/nickel transport system substrate-binding protein
MHFNPPRRRHALLAAAILAVASPALAQPASRNLTIGIGAPPTSVDPHFYNAAPNFALSMHIFDRLVERDAEVTPYPGLAESWDAISPTVWEFKLRRGVTWHDGRPFTAEDVAFSVARPPLVPNSPASFSPFVRAIQRTEIIDTHTVRFHTAAPHPLLPVELGSIAIVAKHAVEGRGTEDYNALRAAIGTGPYRLVSYAAPATAPNSPAMRPIGRAPSAVGTRLLPLRRERYLGASPRASWPATST